MLLSISLANFWMRLMDERMPVGVAVIIRRGDSYLFIKRYGKHGSGTWCVPGGWVELGEDPIQTANREVKEEVGIQLLQTDFIGYSHDIFPEGVEDVCLWFYSDYWMSTDEPSIQEPDKATELSWATYKNIVEKGVDGQWFGGYYRTLKFITLAEKRRLHDSGHSL